MNKAELIEALADKTGLQKQEAKKVLDNFFGKEGINDGRRNLDKPE